MPGFGLTITCFSLGGGAGGGGGGGGGKRSRKEY